MKPTKVILSLVIGALFIAGLFFFFHLQQQDSKIVHLKPSQLDFAQGNKLAPPSNSELNPSAQTEYEAPTQLESFTPQEKIQWSALENILKSKNDNDPRLDQDFKKLSPAFRQALYEKYNALQPENHSEQGLIVYLIAREISSIDDIQFLKKVYQEAPCLSLADCKSVANDDNPHHSSVDQTTLIYKQLSGLYLLDKQLSQNPQLLNDASYRSEIIQVLAEAESYPVPEVREKARAIRIKYGL